MRLMIFVLGLTLCSVGYSAINTETHQNFATYHASALNQKNSMDLRWQAVFSAAQKANKNELNLVKQYANQPEWFMRNAALLAINKFDQPSAEVMAQKLLSDKALVVRSAAVDVLSEKSLMKNRNLLVSELSKAYNFNKQVSLWIRPQIMEKLSHIAKPEEKKFFATYLYDKDPQVVQYSMNALEKITGVTYPGAQRLTAWKRYVKSNHLVQ